MTRKELENFCWYYICDDIPPEVNHCSCVLYINYGTQFCAECEHKSITGVQKLEIFKQFLRKQLYETKQEAQLRLKEKREKLKERKKLSSC